MARNVSHLPRLAVANTSRPQYLANCTAAIPTPPVPAWISTAWPGCTSASSRSAKNAVAKPTVKPAACG